MNNQFIPKIYTTEEALKMKEDIAFIDSLFSPTAIKRIRELYYTQKDKNNFKDWFYEYYREDEKILELFHTYKEVQEVFKRWEKERRENYYPKKEVKITLPVDGLDLSLKKALETDTLYNLNTETLDIKLTNFNKIQDQQQTILEKMNEKLLNEINNLDLTDKGDLDKFNAIISTNKTMSDSLLKIQAYQFNLNTAKNLILKEKAEKEREKKRQSFISGMDKRENITMEGNLIPKTEFIEVSDKIKKLTGQTDEGLIRKDLNGNIIKIVYENQDYDTAKFDKE
jgi:hypothetical protein